MEERNDIVNYKSEDGLVKMEERYLRAENWSVPRSSKKF